MALSELTRAIGCGKREFETVRDLFEAVFDGNAGHVGFLLSMLLILPYVLDTTPRSRVRQVNAELHEKLRMPGVLRCEARARGGDEALQFAERALEVLVDHDVLRFGRVRHLAAGRKQAACDHVRLVLAALFQTL